MSQPGYQRVQIEFHGRPLTVETGRMAKQAGGAALVQLGESVVLVTATALTTAREGIDFFPLTCDYQEKTFAAGKIPGGFFKREGRPAEKEILTSRLIDRPLRPLFPKGFRCETQVIATVLSHDRENDPDVLSLLGASAAACTPCRALAADGRPRPVGAGGALRFTRPGARRGRGAPRGPYTSGRQAGGPSLRSPAARRGARGDRPSGWPPRRARARRRAA